MLTVPKTLCKCADPIKQVTLTAITPVDECYSKQCVEAEPTELIPIVSTLCPCEPIPEIVVNFSPKLRRTRVVKSCFTDFIKNVTSTKFCNTGPTCKVS